MRMSVDGMGPVPGYTPNAPAGNVNPTGVKSSDAVTLVSNDGSRRVRATATSSPAFSTCSLAV